MTRGVSVDISARLTGYEASLKELQAAAAKIDLGSKLGKELDKAIKQAEAQLKSLQKNLNPRATNETQIDSIVEKTNLAGDSIKKVARLIQEVNGQSINFDAFGDGVKKFSQDINKLEGELEGKISAGLQNTIAKSEDLKKVFDGILDIDTKGVSSSQIFDALAKKAAEAEEGVRKVDKTLDELQGKINVNQSKQTAIENSMFGSIGGKQSLEAQANEFQQQYLAVFADLRAKLAEGLKGAITEDSGIDSDTLMDNFFAGLTPETLRAKIEELYNSLKSAGIYTKKADFYNEIFGGGSNINQVVAAIDLGDPQPILDKFNQFIDSIASEIGGGKAAKIKELISANEIEQATTLTVRNIESAFTRIQNTYQKLKDEMSGLLNDQSTAQKEKSSIEATRAVIDTTTAKLQAEVERITSENAQLRNEINQLKQDLAAYKQQKIDQLHTQGAKAGIDAGQWQISAEETNQYKSALDQVIAKEQLVGKIQGVVQRWFSIYAAVRMVGNAIRSVISTVQELDKTITEIAIVTDMTQDELWGQMSSYTEMARQYASSISGVYKVSQLYYQQGLQTADVMALTEQTLKMARISGLGYAEATDYMTNAVRSFKMEMTDVQRVVDVYSEIAASSATSTTELASAMSKTASSAEAVGSSFENTTAMMAVMINKSVPCAA